MSKLKINWDKISDEIKKEESKTTYTKKEADPRFFVPDVSQDGYAEVRIRLLPSIDTDIPYVKKFNHGFQGANGQWFIQNCPTTLDGEKCPVCEANRVLWQGTKADKDIASDRSRRMNIITNILIIRDPLHPENEGKIFLWRYGKKLHEKIMDKVNPKKGSVDEPVMVFDPDSGADFKLKVKRTSFVNRQGKTIKSLNYDTSEFAPVSKLTKEQVKFAEENLIPLKEFIDPKDFKSYDELRNLFEKTTGTVSSVTASEEIPEDKELKEENSGESLASPEGVDGNDKDFFANLRQKAQA